MVTRVLPVKEKPSPLFWASVKLTNSKSVNTKPSHRRCGWNTLRILPSANQPMSTHKVSSYWLSNKTSIKNLYWSTKILPGKWRVLYMKFVLKKAEHQYFPPGSNCHSGSHRMRQTLSVCLCVCPPAVSAHYTGEAVEPLRKKSLPALKWNVIYLKEQPLSFLHFNFIFSDMTMRDEPNSGKNSTTSPTCQICHEHRPSFNRLLGTIWGSHGGDYEDGRLLGCSAVYVYSAHTPVYTALQPRRRPSSQSIIVLKYLKCAKLSKHLKGILALRFCLTRREKQANFSPSASPNQHPYQLIPCFCTTCQIKFNEHGPPLGDRPAANTVHVTVIHGAQ
jgi:hypothetical protein